MPEPTEPRPVSCRQCGASTATGDSFQIVQPYRAASTGFVQGLDADGLVVEWVDRGDPYRFGRPELACSACGHQWPTTREWRSA